MMKIDSKQIQLMHIAKSQLGLSDDDYRLIISTQTKGKKQSSKDLTYFEADAVINYFVKLGFKIQSNYIRTSGAARRERWAHANARRAGGQQRPANVYVMPSKENAAKRMQRRKGRAAGNLFILASQEQLNMINALAGQIRWRFDDGFQRWMKKYIRIDMVRTDDEACKVIEGLKGLLAHQGEGA